MCVGFDGRRLVAVVSAPDEGIKFYAAVADEYWLVVEAFPNRCTSGLGIAKGFPWGATNDLRLMPVEISSYRLFNPLADDAVRRQAWYVPATLFPSLPGPWAMNSKALSVPLSSE
jgi:hypothetical protein